MGAEPTPADLAVAELLWQLIAIHGHQVDTSLTDALTPIEYTPRHGAAVADFIHALEAVEPQKAAEFWQVFEANYPEHARAR